MVTGRKVNCYYKHSLSFSHNVRYAFDQNWLLFPIVSFLLIRISLFTKEKEDSSPSPPPPFSYLALCALLPIPQTPFQVIEVISRKIRIVDDAVQDQFGLRPI